MATHRIIKLWYPLPSSIRLILIAVLFSAVLIGLVTGPAQAATTNARPPMQEETPADEGPDLSGVSLTLEDMPPGFEELQEAQKEAMISALAQMGRLMGSGTDSAMRIQNATGYWNGDQVNMQLIVSLLISPLNEAEQANFDRTVAKPEQLVRPIGRMLGSDAEAALLEGFEDYGETSIGYSIITNAAGVDLHMDIISARRGPVVEQVLVGYLGDQEPAADVHQIARLLDDRLMEVVTPPPPPGSFRPVDTLVPELTTRIPTPLDISFEPEVVGANLFLAAIVMMLLTIAVELANRTLEENETLLQRIFRPFRGLGKIFGKRGTGVASQGSGTIALSLLLLGFIILVYGITFSLLEPGWSLTNTTGFWLFLCLTIGGGFAGLADDVIQWVNARRWGAPTAIHLQPANLLLAFASTGISRLFGVIPGFMFGTPQAIEIDSEALEKRRQTRLIWTGAFTILAVGLVLWLTTILTTSLVKSEPPRGIIVFLGGVESLFLSIFALVVQNAFVQMLDLPGSYGRALKRVNRWIWLLLLLAITFIFYHTLINPKGNLASAWASVNVKVFVITAAVGMVLSLLVWLGFRLFNRQRGKVIPTLAEDPQHQGVIADSVIADTSSSEISTGQVGLENPIPVAPEVLNNSASAEDKKKMS